ncbi:MAG: DUF3152 domain-containing protein [Hamadaea sp.]|uniref:DUF3152 domain-containing protein n=1 Tax=Hamadaea sp. TaxID=2024425 RepID=UPI00179805C1|nr:DUF3152 domain-containing protein [Hamadaea sp.]NUR73114.1 DUF3152 domain-containing protein [Hamadaea sp.]NUT23026.1 DUF3152 domain-containing protein [Hamadaea sp.]
MRRIWIPAVSAVICAVALVGCKPAAHDDVAEGPSGAGPSAVDSSQSQQSPVAKLALSGENSPTPAAITRPTGTAVPLPRRSPTRVFTNSLPARTDRTNVPIIVADQTPVTGAGTFAIATGNTGVVGNGETLVKYQVEVEQGINWGRVAPWTAAGFATAVDGILGNERGWIASAAHPVTDPAEGMSNESWSFQRVSDGTYGVRIRLATPTTVDKLCGSAGVDTEGVYSCRYGKNILINLRRWLYGADGFTDMPAYRQMVISHETGHFLGFSHMLCPGAGQLAPVMQTQTIALNGCLPNPYPFTEDGRFVMGPWAPS